MNRHVNKISRLLHKNVDVDRHIVNISSYKLSFFEKLVLCRGLKFAFPRKVSSIEIKASFERAYWKLEPTLPPGLKDLTSATLRSVALNYAQRKSSRPPKALLRAISSLRKRDDIVVTKPDKGTGVVIMNKSDYLRLLSEVSINDTTKFRKRDVKRPKMRGRPPKHYHPLLAKEKHLQSVVRNILPKSIADLLCPKGSRLAHLYGFTQDS